MLQAVALDRKAPAIDWKSAAVDWKTSAVDWIVAQHGTQVTLTGKSAFNRRSKKLATDFPEPYDAQLLLPLSPADSDHKPRNGILYHSCTKRSKQQGCLEGLKKILSAPGLSVGGTPINDNTLVHNGSTAELPIKKIIMHARSPSARGGG